MPGTPPAQLEALARGIRRARFNEAAEKDPDSAAWPLRTRTRYDEHGNFSLTISGPTEYLPVLQAGIDAKRAELQRERDAEPAATKDDVDASASVEVDAGSAPDVFAETHDARGDVPTPTRVDDRTDADADADADQQAAGWPAGATHRQVRRAFASLSALVTDLGREQAELDAQLGVSTTPPAPPSRRPLGAGASPRRCRSQARSPTPRPCSHWRRRRWPPRRPRSPTSHVGAGRS